MTFQGRPTTIVGVLRGVHVQGPEREVRSAMYTPLAQWRFVGPPGVTFGTLVVRTAHDARHVAPAVREAIRPVPGLDPGEPRFVEDFFRRVTAGRRFNAGVMATFGFIAVALGAIGVYGMMAFVVARQVRAIGIRMALGATPSHVMRSVLHEAFVHVALGILIGLGAAWTVSGALRSFVFQISPEHPAVYAAVAGFLGTIGLAAAFVPAFRAARLDPLEALRHE